MQVAQHPAYNDLRPCPSASYLTVNISKTFTFHIKWTHTKSYPQSNAQISHIQRFLS
uniref:Uncharacterized protein n=1 Tax=Anguilla anguilla TaxID=7936 RepID=A0A0E9XKS0_ANGAN